MLAATVLILALAVEAKSPTPPYAALTSPTESARYAFTHGCLATVREGVQLADRPNHFIRMTDEKKGLYRMVGAGHVEMSDKLGPVCYLSVKDGSGEKLRAMVLELLAAEAPVRTVHDATITPPDSKTTTFREERMCVQLGGRPVFALMTTGEARSRRKLQLTLAGGSSAHAAACLAVKAP